MAAALGACGVGGEAGEGVAAASAMTRVVLSPRSCPGEQARTWNGGEKNDQIALHPERLAASCPGIGAC